VLLVEIIAIIEPLLAVWYAIRDQVMMLDRQMLARARNDDVAAYSGDCDRPFRSKVITDSADRDHAVTRPTGSA